MKLITVTALKEYSKNVTSIFTRAGINVYSATDIIGFRDGSQHNLMDSWFGMGDARFDSVLFFSFTEEDKASTAMKYIREYNQENAADFPLRAFIMAVENSSH